MLSTSLLSTKLYLPPARMNATPRPRLTEKLLSVTNQPGNLALLSGPAGFGKTTLLSEFAAQLRIPVAWLSLDDNDDDSVRFWTYVIAACQSVQGKAGESAMALLQSPQPLPGEVIVTALINDIAALECELTLILDDFHTIQSEDIHTAFVFLLEHLPEKLHLVVSTRIDPPWPLARFRVRNSLVEIRAEDLRFTIEEASSFFNQRMGLSLTAEEVAILEQRTEGWVAGLQLAGLSMKGRQDIAGFVQAFKGSHAYIAEYLVEEVLNRQPKEVQEFLLHSSLMDKLNASLCEAVTGCSDGQSMLSTLYRQNLLLVPLDDQGEWFRYHHLFSDLLRARLQRNLPKSEVRQLHRRAANWFEQAAMLPEALEHALEAEDYSRTVQLIENVALPMILQAHVRTVERWLRAIPDEFVQQSPGLNMAFAWMNLLRGTPVQAMVFIDRLKDIYAQLEEDKHSPSIQGQWLAIQSELLIAQGNPEASRDLAYQALKILPGVDANVRSMIYVTLAKAFQLTYDYSHAAEVFQMIVRDAQSKGDPVFEILGISGEAQMGLKQGRLHRTFELASEAIRRLETYGIVIPFSATLYGEIGEVQFHWHQLDQARTYLLRSMQTSGKSGYSDPEIYYYLMLAKIHQMEGDLEAAALEMRKATDLADQIPPAMIRANVHAQQVRFDLARHRLDAAKQTLQSDGFGFGDPIHFPGLDSHDAFPFDVGILYNSALRLLLHIGRSDEDRPKLETGIGLSERVLRGEVNCQHLPLALETLLLRSQLFAALGESRRSLIEAAKALELAEPEGFISIFVEEGKALEDTLAILLKSDLAGKVRGAYIRNILAAFPQAVLSQSPSGPSAARSHSGGNGTSHATALVEPLSARELEVLGLIAGGDSNQAIADKLYVTLSAIKKHTTSIFGKMNVNSRTQAVARGRQLGLIPAEL